jgi:hypothetical protein
MKILKGLRRLFTLGGKGQAEKDPRQAESSRSEEIPIDENVVNYKTNKTAGEEGKKVALKKSSAKPRKKA